MIEHLSNIDAQKREREAIFRLFAILGLPHLIETKYSIYSRFYIIGKNLPYHYFLNKKQDIGDIDVCLIPCQSSFNHEIISIAPNLDRIFGIEVKTMAYGLDNRIKSAKFKFEQNSLQDEIQAKAREEANKLIQNGFDDVSLLYLLTTEPLDSNYGNISDWFEAGERALQATGMAFAQWGTQELVAELDKLSMNEVDISDKKSGVTTKREIGDTERAIAYNKSGNAANDTKMRRYDIENSLGIKNSSKIRISTEVPVAYGYGMKANGDVVDPDGNVVLGSAWGKYKDHMNIRIYRNAKYSSWVYRHEFIHGYHYYFYNFEVNVEASEHAAYYDSYYYNLSKGKINESISNYKNYIDFGSRSIPHKAYENNFNLILNKIQKIK